MVDAKLTDAAAVPYTFGYFNDFTRPDDFVTAGGVTGTAISSGTLAAQATNGAWARLSSVANTASTGYQIQTAASFVVTQGKPLMFKIRQQVGEATSTDGATDSLWFVGLAVIDTSLVASAPTDGFWFGKADTTSAITINARAASGTATSTTLPSTYVEDKAVHTYGINVTPVTSTTCDVQFFIDGVRVGAHLGVTSPLSTIVLAASAAFNSGAAGTTGTKRLDIDYIGAAQVR